MSKELIGSHSVHETLVRQTQIDAARIEELEREVERKMSAADFILKERDALQADNALLRKALKKMNRAYVGLMENARYRIIMLGGDCAPVDVMEYRDQNLRESCAALSDTPAQSLARLRNRVIEQMIACYSPDDSAHDYFDKLNAMKEPE